MSLASVNWYAIESAVRDMLRADTTLEPTPDVVPVFIEEDFLHGLTDNGVAVVIYAERRTPHQDQTIGMGKRTRFLGKLSVWVRAYHVESMQAACALRDPAVGLVEGALMKDRSLGGTVAASWLEGGDMLSACNQQTGAYMASAEVALMVDVAAVNP